MKIMFAIGTMSKGGAERVVANLSNYLQANGHEVVITTTIESKSYYHLNEQIKLYSLDNNNDKNFVTKNIIRLKNLSKIIKQETPDIVLSFLPEPSYRVLLLKALNRNLKVIVSVRNDPKIEYASRINNLVMRILYPLANGFVFQTEEAKEYFSKKIQSKSIVIPNPIGIDFINAKINSNKKNLIISVGRLEPQKNHKMLIEAFSRVANEIPTYNLVIYGEGSLRNELEQIIKQKGLSERISLPGSTEKVIDKLNEAKVFVLSSDYEGMPNALMEAMAMGLACISTDCPCGGPKYLINDGKNGILIETNNAVELANKIQKLVSDEQEMNNIAKHAINIRESLHPERIQIIWERYIERIAGE